MWSIVLLVNSCILTLVSVYFIYSIGMAFLVGAWKGLLIAFIVFIFFCLSEVALGAIAD